MKILNLLKQHLGLALLLLGLSLESQASAAICPQPLRVHLDLTAPSAFYAADGQLTGMDVEMLRQIAAAAACDLTFDLTPRTGARILKSVERGELDLMIRASITPDRQQYAHFSKPYRKEVVGLFHQSHVKLPENFTLARAWQYELRLIGPASGWYGYDFEQMRSHFQKQQRYTAYPDAAIATELFFATPSRGELLLVDADIFYALLSPPQVAKVQLAGDWLHQTPAHLMFSRTTVNAATVRALDEAISKLLANGTLRQIEASFRPEAIQRLTDIQFKPERRKSGSQDGG